MFYLGLIAIMFGLKVPILYWILYLIDFTITFLFNAVAVGFQRKIDYFETLLSVLKATTLEKEEDIKNTIRCPKYWEQAKMGFSLLMFIILINSNYSIFHQLGYNHIPFIEGGVIVLYILGLILYVTSVIISANSEPEIKIGKAKK